jgi:hypothetical protein
MAKPTIVTGSTPGERAEFRGMTLSKAQGRAAIRAINSITSGKGNMNKEEKRLMRQIKSIFPK